MKAIKDCLFYTFPFLLLIVFYPTNLAAQENPIIYLEWYENPLETMVINWIGDAGANRTVEYRTRGSSGNWNSHTASVNNLPNTSKRRYRQKITGLSPGTSYEFRIGGISGTRYFRTAPSSIEEPIQFIVGGDITETRGNNVSGLREIFEAVTDIAAEYNPLFVTVGGDWVHAPGDYPDVDDWFYLLETWTEKLVTNEGSYMVPIFGSAGNHEVPEYGSSPEDAIFYHGFLSYPQEQWGEKRGYGVVDFSDYLSIITLDTGLMHSVTSQNNWLQNTLQNRTNVPHVYPVYHVPGWPTFRTMRDGTGLIDSIRNEWHPFFRDNNVRLVFEHHDHSFKRTHSFRCTPPINNPPDCTVDERNGVIYTGGGTWGSGVRDLHENFTSGGDQWVHEVNELENNFVLMEVSERSRTLRAVSLNRGIVDTFYEVFFLPPPEATAATEVSATSFTANWEPVPDTEQYRLDVSTNSNFSTFVSGYQNRNVGNNTSRKVTDLAPGQTYYYRVRARTAPVQSNYSNAIQTETVAVDPDLSSMSVSNEPVEADNQDAATVTVIIRDEDGNELGNVDVELISDSGSASAVQNNLPTDSDGRVEFEVINSSAEVVTFGAIAGEEELTDKVEVTFIPAAPVILSATEVQTRQFVSNWEIEPNADTYFLDVSTSSDFADYLEGYQNREVGNVTSQMVDGVLPGTDYYYRVRGQSVNLTGADSEPMQVTTFPETPVADNASDQNALRFTANWQSAEGAKTYLLDVAKDENFEEIVSDYDGYEVGNIQTFNITGLELDTNYYYRVRSKSSHRISDYSNIIQTFTLGIDQNTSEIVSAQLRVFADGNQSNQITVKLKSSDGRELKELEVNLTADSETAEIEVVDNITNDDGEALFQVTNTVAEEVTYSVSANSVHVGEITLEFLQDDGELSLGDNFPNPFNNQTVIPLTIPSPMDVKIEVYNSLGNPVQTLVNERLETGYYEIPFQMGGLASGVYFYRMITGSTIDTKKMILIK